MQTELVALKRRSEKTERDLNASMAKSVCVCECVHACVLTYAIPCMIQSVRLDFIVKNAMSIIISMYVCVAANVERSTEKGTGIKC